MPQQGARVNLVAFRLRLRPAGAGLRARWRHCGLGGGESREARGSAGALAEAHGGTHRGLLQVHPGAVNLIGSLEFAYVFYLRICLLLDKSCFEGGGDGQEVDLAGNP